MGLHRLVLVNPARFLIQADWRAAGAMDVLDDAQVVTCLPLWPAVVRGRNEYTGSGHSLACDGEDVGAVLTEQAEGAEIAILFGREDSGLTNELQRCHALADTVLKEQGR